MIRFHYFAYAKEAGYLSESVASLMRTMSAEGYVAGIDYDVTVVDDAYAPMGDHVSARLRDQGATYRLSTFDRGGNLRGQACLMGVLSEYDRTVQSRAGDIVVKIDPDTIVRRAGWIADLLQPDGADMIYCDDRGAMYGMVYGFRACLIAPLIDYFATMPIPHLGQEDIYLGHRLLRLASRSRQIPMWSPRRYGDDPNGPDGVVTCYPWPSGQGRLPSVYDQFAVVNIGQSRQHWVSEAMMIDLISLLVPTPPASTVLPVEADSAAQWSPLPPSIFNQQ